MGTPSTYSITSTRPVVRAWTISGQETQATPAFFSRNSSAFLASSRKSSSCWATAHISSSTMCRSTTPPSSVSFIKSAARWSRGMSRAMVSRTPGRWTLTTTRRPSGRTAACTWAMEAEPSGSGEKEGNTSSSGRAYSSSATPRTSSRERGRTSARSLASSAQ